MAQPSPHGFQAGSQRKGPERAGSVKMPTKQFETLIAADLQAVWNFHSSARALDELTPPGRKMRWVSKDLTVREGAVHEFQVKLGPFWVTWKAELSGVVPPHAFVDTALESPFKSWTHRHEFIARPNGTVVRDTVRYVPPFGIVGALANWLFLSKDIDRLFAYRHRATSTALEEKE